jgi:3',5'-cyclic AMP phosphodiesterase CpdA
MKLLVTSDLHLVQQWREIVLTRLREWVTAHRPDGIVIAGDLSDSTEAANSLKRLREIFPNGPIALTLGNHDFWVEPGNGCRSLAEVIDRQWKPAADQFAVSLLDRENLPVDEVTLVGAYGHYDLGFRFPGLRYEGELVTPEDYLEGKPPIPTLLRWRDFFRMPRNLDLLSVAHEQVRDLQARLRSVTEKRALVVLHTPPFAALLGVPDISTLNLQAPTVYTFFRAYLGNEKMGTMLHHERDRIIGVVCGHTHREVAPLDFGNFFGLNVGSDYGEPVAYLFETKTSHLTKLSGRDGSSVLGPDKDILSA